MAALALEVFGPSEPWEDTAIGPSIYPSLCVLSAVRCQLSAVNSLDYAGGFAA